MKVQPINAMQTNKTLFKGNELMKFYKKGKLKITHGFYGGLLDVKNASKEHLQCKCYGGKNTKDNIVLTTKELNNKRGNKPLIEVLDVESAKIYLNEILENNIKGFDKFAYVKGIIKKVYELTGIKLEL